MSRSVSPIRKLLHLLLAVSFLAAGAANPYGVDTCPMHRLPSHGRTAAGAMAGGHAQIAGRRTEGGSSPMDGPCRCIGTCHASALAPVPAEVQHAIAVDEAPEITPPVPHLGRQSVRGPRHHPFALHLPNAPPHLG